MDPVGDKTALEKACELASRESSPKDSEAATQRASMWALISIADTLSSLYEDGIEIYERDLDGHRKYR